MGRCTSSIFLGVALSLLILFLGATPLSAQQIRVVTTFPILADFAAQVGGELVAVTSLVPQGVDPHSWEPAAKDVLAFVEADLLLANGGRFDDWLVVMEKNMATSGKKFIRLSQGLPGGMAQADDPHFWLSIPYAINYVEQITVALQSLAPENGASFIKRSQEYIGELKALDQWALAETAHIPPQNRILVTYHNAFGYFGQRYGFKAVEYLVANPEAEPSPREISKLVNLVKQMDQPAVFAEPQLSVGNRYLEILASEAGAEIFVLYSDSLTASMPTYLEMMEYNIKTVVEALVP